MVTVKQLSPWDFDVNCACGNWQEISWFHGAPPPTFERSEDQPALPLFELEHM
jgi:hypothetical protein